MKIERMKLSALRNEEHYQLTCEQAQQFAEHCPVKQQLEPQLNRLNELLIDERAALLVVRKSAISDMLSEAHKVRGTVYRCLTGAVNFHSNHFDPVKKAAAKRISVLLDHYGNLAEHPYNDATVAVGKLVDEAMGAYKNDFEMLDLLVWVTELQDKNNSFNDLMQQRYDSELAKTDLKMRDVRTQVDAALRDLIERINAMILLNGPAGFETLVAAVNNHFAKYRMFLGQRKGRSDKQKDTE